MTSASRSGVTMLGIGETHAPGENEFEDKWSIAADGVVLATQQVSDDLLFRELTSDHETLEAAGIAAVYCIGDALAPPLPSEAVFDGHRLARELDMPDPSFALPWLRERAGAPGHLEV